MSSVNNLLDSLNGSTTLHYDKWSDLHAYRGVGQAFSKRWIANVLPCELLTRSLKRAIDSVVTLTEGNVFYRTFPEGVVSPSIFAIALLFISI